ncbi:MAG: hypothetical protein AAGB12_15655 [Pseudomonadota bacterium]
MNVAKSLLNAPWANLVDLTHWELGVPEMREVIDETNAWCIQNHLAYEVVVCPLYTQIELAKISHKLLPNVNTQIVSTEQEAMLWLKEKGFNVA